MTVREPNDIDKSEITEQGVENFAAIVYEKSPTNPGLKQLGLADLKSVLDYNSHKADNIALLCGFPKDAEEDEHCYDYKNGNVTIPTEGTLASQIQAVAANAGVPVTQSSPLNPLAPRLAKVETNLGTLSDDPDKTLIERMDEAEDEISGLAEEIGGYSPSGTPLTNRVGALEATVNGNGEPGLTTKVADLETTVGTSSSGLVKDVAQLKDEVETASTGLMDQVAALRTEIGTPPVGASDINTRVEENTSDIEELKQTAATAYKFQGSVEQSNIESKVVNPAIAGTLKGGEVWDCLTLVEFNYPALGQTGSKHYKYDKGTNFAFVKGTDGEPNRFDELGVSFDTSAIESDIDKLKSKFDTKPESGSGTISSWDSSGLLGTYLISGYKRLGQVTTTFAFIASFDEGGTLISDAPIDLSTTFGNLFEVDSTSGKIKMKTAAGFLSQLNTLKLS